MQGTPGTSVWVSLTLSCACQSRGPRLWPAPAIAVAFIQFYCILPGGCECPGVAVTHPDLLGLTGAQPGAVTDDSKAMAEQTVAQDEVLASGTPSLSLGDMCVTNSGARDGICGVVAAAVSWGTHLCHPSLSDTCCSSQLWPSQHWRIDPEVGAIHSCPVCQGG